MEYCEEGDLHFHIQRQLLQKAKFLEKTILNWLLQMLMALEHIHRSQIVHRDIKSSNIFLTSCGSIKIGDFGIAKVLTQTIQTTNTLVGTPNYLSPEVCENKPYTYKTDIWALGCVLYELCTLKVPFQATNLMELLIKISKDDIEPIPRVYSMDLSKLLKSLLAKDDAKRPSCQEILTKPIFIKVMQEFITKDVKDFNQKKIPIKEYSIHNQLKKKSPQKIIHKKPINPKPNNGSNKSEINPKKGAGLKKGSNIDTQRESDQFKNMKSKIPISPVKGVSFSSNNKAKTPIINKKLQVKNKLPIKPNSSLSKKPESNSKSKAEEKLKVAGIAIKNDHLERQKNNNEIIKGPLNPEKQNQKDEEDPTINSILMNTEISFNISLTQVSIFKYILFYQKIFFFRIQLFIPKTCRKHLAKLLKIL